MLPRTETEHGNRHRHGRSRNRRHPPREPPAAPADHRGPPGAIALATWGVRHYIFSRHHVTTDNAQVDGHITVIAPRIAGLRDPGAGGGQSARQGGRHAGRARRPRPARSAGAGRGRPARTPRPAVQLAARRGQAQAQLQATRAEAASRAGRRSPRPRRHCRKASADLERYRGAGRPARSSRRSSSTRPRRRATPRAANLEAARKQAAAARQPGLGLGRRASRRRRPARRGPGGGRQRPAPARATPSSAAPTAGIVAKRSAEPGALVQVGQNLMSIVPDERRLGHGQPQGDPARQGAGRRPGRVQRRRLSGPRPSTARSRA